MRRIAAIVLPEIACEIARRDHALGDAPFAVIVDEDESPEALSEDLEKSAVLHAVDRRAWQYGARPGQSASQAAAYVSRLQVVRITKSRVLETLGAVAEISLGFGINSALALHIEKGRLPLRDEALAASLRYPLGAGAGPYDTVWLDVTGCSKLIGGDDVLTDELEERVGELGHRARVAIADGPRIAQAIARWTPPARTKTSGELALPPGQSGAFLQRLSTAALPLAPDMITWLGKLGILRIEDLAELDRARLSHRLGPAARDLLELIAGRDSVPLCGYQPARRIVEATMFEHEIHSTEPLMFVLRGLASRAVARLTARGEACSRAKIQLGFDRSVIALRNRSRAEPLSSTDELTLDLPVPLSRESELISALSVKLERSELEAPVISIALVLDELTEECRHQLELGGTAGADPSALPTLLAELQAHLGRERVGVLESVDSHRPEARGRLVPVDFKDHRRPGSSPPDEELPTRILPEPIPIATPDRDALIVIDKKTFIVERLRHTARLDDVEWWSSEPLHRDYARVWLRADDDESEAWIFIDRSTGQAHVHGWFE